MFSFSSAQLLAHQDLIKAYYYTYVFHKIYLHASIKSINASFYENWLGNQYVFAPKQGADKYKSNGLCSQRLYNQAEVTRLWLKKQMEYNHNLNTTISANNKRKGRAQKNLKTSIWTPTCLGKISQRSEAWAGHWGMFCMEAAFM